MPDKQLAVVTVPPHYVTMHTRDLVKHSTAFGLSVDQIAVLLKTSPEIVRSSYKEELEHGLQLVNAQVQNAVLHKALYEGDVSAMKLWLTNRAGWRGDGARIGVGLNVNSDGSEPSDMSVVERHEIITRTLHKVTRDKRNGSKIIEGQVIPNKEKVS